MINSKKIARDILFPAMVNLGFDRLIRALSSNSILNIMYHGVVKEDSNYFSPRNITYEQFEEQLKYLKKNFNIVSVREAFEIIKLKKKLNKKTITISFDDGLQNNLYTALPIIEKYKVPVSIFISSICLEEMEIRCLWAEKIAALKYFYPNELISVDKYNFKSLFDSENKVSLPEFIKSCKYGERDIIIMNLENKYKLAKCLADVREEVWKLMTKNEVVQLSQSPYIEIGSHGHLHYNLGKIELENSREELIKSKKLLENAINKKIDMIAYPDGCYTEKVKELAHDIGYNFQLAVNYKYNNDKLDPRIMDRHGVSSTTTLESNIIFINRAFHSKGTLKN